MPGILLWPLMGGWAYMKGDADWKFGETGNNRAPEAVKRSGDAGIEDFAGLPPCGDAGSLQTDVVTGC